MNDKKMATAASGSMRPWQGTYLGVVDIIAVVFSFLGGLLLIFMQGVITSFLNGNLNNGSVQTTGDSAAATGVLGILGSFALVIGIVLIGVGVLAIFMARGAFKGQKWSPIVSIVFAALGILGSLSNFQGSEIVKLALQGLTLYAAIICIQHPYFNKKVA